MGETVTVLAYAKLNLSLDIAGKRPDGYHLVEMVMQSVDLYDTVTVSMLDKSIELRCNNDEIPVNNHNIAYKAAEEFFNSQGIKSGTSIKIKKRIPIAAGLGGGSADAAAVLVGLNHLYETNLSILQLCELGSRLGADVPFCITGGTSLAEGVGTILTPLPSLEDCSFVIVKEGNKRSTAEMYKQFGTLTNVKRPETRLLVNSICEGDILKAATYMGNVFEGLWGEKFIEIKDDLMQQDALNATLSGSGPSVYSVFENEQDAAKCKNALSDKYQQIFVCKPTKTGCEIQ